MSLASEVNASDAYSRIDKTSVSIKHECVCVRACACACACACVCVCVCVCVLKQGYVLLAGDCCVYVCLSGARLCFAW